MAGNQNNQHVIFQIPFITLKYLHLQVTLDNETCVNWMKQYGLLANEMRCTRCQNQCAYVNRHDVVDGHGWKCGSRNCRTRVGLRNGSFFAGHNLPLSTCLEVLYWWSMDVPQYIVQEQLMLSNHTVIDWFKYIRDVCTAFILDHHQPIGGPNVIVEIDESKFMHRKYHRGAHVDGVWILGLLERDNPAHCVLIPCPNNSRSADTLLPLITHNVLPGTTIYTDQWAAYRTLQQQGFHHESVNHSLHFCDPVTLVHTNNIEGAWALAKSKYRTMHGTTREMFESYLSYFVWRRMFPERRFEHIINQISEYYPVV